MASGYFITGITTGNLIKLVKRNGIGWHPKYVYRFIFLLFCSLGTSLFKLLEKLLFSEKINSASPPQDPIIIVGHWRSGTTFLHQLFSALPGFKTPSMLEIGTPESFLVSKKILSPIIRKLLPAKRSTDNIDLGLDTPQEDEFALFRATTYSPVEELVFPGKDKFFINGKCDFIPKGGLKKRWKKALLDFCTKLSILNEGRIVLKNPFHSTRIVFLKKIFPKAKFIHIRRNPYHVLPSTIRMWKIEGINNGLRDGHMAPSMERAIAIYDTVLRKIKHDFQKIPKSDYCTIQYEDLVENPVATMCHACRSIGVELSLKQVEDLRSFVRSVGKYKKNSYDLSEEQVELIRTRLHHHLEETVQR